MSADDPTGWTSSPDGEGNVVHLVAVEAPGVVQPGSIDVQVVDDNGTRLGAVVHPSQREVAGAALADVDMPAGSRLLSVPAHDHKLLSVLVNGLRDDRTGTTLRAALIPAASAVAAALAGGGEL